MARNGAIVENLSVQTGRWVLTIEFSYSGFLNKKGSLRFLRRPPRRTPQNGRLGRMTATNVISIYKTQAGTPVPPE